MPSSSSQNSDRYAILAFTLPLIAFMLLGTLEGLKSFSAYYSWLYAAKMLLVLAVWCYFFSRKFYPRFSSQGFGWGVAAGIFGVVLWVFLSRLESQFGIFGWLPEWLTPTQRVGFNPYKAIDSVPGRWAFLAMRIMGLAVIVPLMEEIFWRGFLIQFLISDDFRAVPMGRYTPFSFWTVTILFTCAHTEILAAFVWGAGINLLFYRTRNIWACITAHAVTNLLLGVYVLVTHTWQLW